MLRTLVAAALLANLLFFVWSQGWLSPLWPPPRHGEREPERLAAQVRPEAVQLLSADAASAAARTARAAAAAAATCLEAGPFALDSVLAAEAALAAVPVPVSAWQRVTAPAAGPWWVYAGRYADAAERRARREELARLGLAAEPVEAPAELAPGWLISRHASRAAAEAALETMTRSTALGGARVVEGLPAAPALWLRVAAADAELATRLRALPREALGVGFRPCAPAGN